MGIALELHKGCTGVEWERTFCWMARLWDAYTMYVQHGTMTVRAFLSMLHVHSLSKELRNWVGNPLMYTQFTTIELHEKCLKQEHSHSTTTCFPLGHMQILLMLGQILTAVGSPLVLTHKILCQNVLHIHILFLFSCQCLWTTRGSVWSCQTNLPPPPPPLWARWLHTQQWVLSETAEMSL